MANMFVTEFDDLLATEDMSENNILPSPNKLLRKVILKGRASQKKKVVALFLYIVFALIKALVHRLRLTAPCPYQGETFSWRML